MQNTTNWRLTVENCKWNGITSKYGGIFFIYFCLQNASIENVWMVNRWLLNRATGSRKTCEWINKIYSEYGVWQPLAWNFNATRNVSIYEIWRRCHVERTFISHFFSLYSDLILQTRNSNNQMVCVQMCSVAVWQKHIGKFIAIHISWLCSRHNITFVPGKYVVVHSFQFCFVVHAAIVWKWYVFFGLLYEEYLSINYTLTCTYTQAYEHMTYSDKAFAMRCFCHHDCTFFSEFAGWFGSARNRITIQLNSIMCIF